MKRKIIILLTLMPFLALGQSNLYTNSFGDRYLSTEIGFEKHQIWKTSNILERNIETTLINDATYYKSILNFNLDKSYGLSFTINNDKSFKFIDDQKLDKMLLEVRPLMYFKGQIRKPIDTKSLFEN